MKKNGLLFYTLTVIFIFLGYKLLRISISALSGPNQYVEIYLYNYPENLILHKLTELKETYPDCRVPPNIHKPNGDKCFLKDGKGDLKDRFDFWFFLPDSNQLVYFFIDSLSSNRCRLSLVSFNNGLTLGNWKKINQDFNHNDNKAEIMLFEKRILNKLNLEYEKKYDGSSILQYLFN